MKDHSGRQAGSERIPVKAEAHAEEASPMKNSPDQTSCAGKGNGRIFKPHQEGRGRHVFRTWAAGSRMYCRGHTCFGSALERAEVGGISHPKIARSKGTSTEGSSTLRSERSESQATTSQEGCKKRVSTAPKRNRTRVVEHSRTWEIRGGGFSPSEQGISKGAHEAEGYICVGQGWAGVCGSPT